MKGDSIEETKKQLELILKVRKEQKEIIECAGGSCINCDPDIKALTESIDILSNYKRALKENEEWDRKFCNLQNLYFKLQDESESKRKEYQETYKDVRKELKEWQEAYKSEKKMKNEYVKLYQDLLLKENVISIQKIIAKEVVDILKQILQELLESEEKNDKNNKKG